MRMFRNALRAGIPFGVLVGAAIGLTRWDWRLALLGGLGAATLQGLIGASLALSLGQKMRWSELPLMGIEMGLSGLIIGIGLAFAVSAASEMPRGRWRRLPDLPEPATEILGHGCYNLLDGGDLYVRTGNGTIYVYHDGSTPVAWRQASAYPPPTPTGVSSHEYTAEHPFPTPRPPGQVVDAEAVYLRAVDTGAQVDYILLIDGSLWQAYRGWNAYEYLGQFLAIPLAGLFFGFVVGFILPCVVERKG